MRDVGSWQILLQKSVEKASNRDSVVLTRISARSSHDGPAEERTGSAFQFNLKDAVPDDHLVRRIDTALDLSWLRSELEYPLAEESINSRGK